MLGPAMGLVCALLSSDVDVALVSGTVACVSVSGHTYLLLYSTTIGIASVVLRCISPAEKVQPPTQ